MRIPDPACDSRVILLPLLLVSCPTPRAPTVGLDTRPLNQTCLAPAAAGGGVSVSIQRAFAGLTFTLPVLALQAPGDGSRWFVIQKRGVVRVFANLDQTASTDEFIDISARVNSTPNEAGLLGMAFHPRFSENGQVFLSYTAPSSTAALRSTIARFISRDGGRTLDPNSEQIVLTVEQPYDNHNGGYIAFGPDGYLYIGLGDGGSGGDPQGHGQNPGSLLGKMLRIDVDGAAPYAIPGDNPFAGGGGRPEIYALGLRNPWRWSFDRATGDLWLADVGQSNWEEVDRIERGGNYGWNTREGKHCFRPATGCATAGLIDPLVEYDHSQGVSITGGYVYRGTAVPGLAGRFVYGDFGSGRIWAVGRDPDTGQPRAELLATSGLGISGFGQGIDGELLVLDYYTGRLHRILPQTTAPAEPIAAQLSLTGCADPSDPRLPAAGMIPYDVNAPLWSDATDKQRWLAIPDGTRITVAADGDWDLPPGSVLRKDFAIGGTPIETRLLVRHEDGSWAGYSYAWNDAGTDAQLLPASLTRNIGGLTWRYPDRGQCLLCHTGAAGRTLGLETGQLNRDLRYPATGRVANQLATLEHIGMLAAPLGAVADLPRLPSPTDANAALGARARAYLHGNCAMCHRPGGTGQGPADLRYTTPLDAATICDVLPTQGDLGVAEARLVAPGAPARSVLALRVRALDTTRMPPLGSQVVDPDGVALLDTWIARLTTCSE